MATTPFRLPEKIAALLQKFSGMARITMTDWILERINEEEEYLRTKVQPFEDRPSLIRDLYAWRRSNLEGKKALKAQILSGLTQGAYDLNERGVDNLTPLHWAAREQGDVELVSALVQAGHPVSPLDENGNSPLVLALVEQDRRLEINLSVIQYLLAHSTDLELLIHPPRLGYGQTLFDYAKSFKMSGTVGLIRNRFQEVNLDLILRDLPAHDIPERLCRVLYFQGKAWDVIASEMSNRGIEPSMIWFQLNRMGAWQEHLSALRARGVPDPECILALRKIQAAWPDISWAYLKIGYRPAEIISILIQTYRASGDETSSLSTLVAGAIPVEGDGDLIPVKGLLEGLGEDPYEIVQRMPFVQERKDSILSRMGLPPKKQKAQAG